MQKVKNEAMRKIFRAPEYAPIVAMRGGIGIGTMKSRVIRDRLQYPKKKIQGNNEFVKEVIEKMLGRSQIGGKNRYLSIRVEGRNSR